MADEVTVLNRSPRPIYVETGRLPPYETRQVSTKWYGPRRGDDRCVDVSDYRDRILQMGASSLRAECQRADLPTDGAPPELRRGLLDHVGASYDDADLYRDDDRVEGAGQPDYESALEMKWHDKLAFVADHRNDPIPDDARDTDALDGWIRDQMGGE
jgi:hypothetical protein